MSGPVLSADECPTWCKEHCRADDGTTHHHGDDRRVSVHRKFPEQSVSASPVVDGSGSGVEVYAIDDMRMESVLLRLTGVQALRLATALSLATNDHLAVAQ